MSQCDNKKSRMTSLVHEEYQMVILFHEWKGRWTNYNEWLGHYLLKHSPSFSGLRDRVPTIESVTDLVSSKQMILNIPSFQPVASLW
jgi:hypothetical protein